jgi:hypothetical protein
MDAGRVRALEGAVSVGEGRRPAVDDAIEAVRQPAMTDDGQR